MAPNGGQDDGAGDKRIPTDRNKGKKPMKRLLRGTIPHYLQNLRMLSSPSHVQEASPSHVQEASPSHVQEASPSHVQERSPSSTPSPVHETLASSTHEVATPTSSLLRPTMLPAGTSQSQPTATTGCSASSGSNVVAGSTTRPTTTPRRFGPRRNITSDVPKDANDRFIVELSVDNKIIDNHIATVVTSIFQEYPQPVAYTFRMISNAILEKYWEEFRKRCVWDTCKYSDDTMKKAFNHKLKNRYKGTLNRIRKAEQRPIWCPDDVWEPWLRMWDSPEFKRKSESAKKARVGEDGVAKGTHTGGSCAHAKTAKKIEKELGRPLTVDQLFLWGHTHEHDGVTFVNDRCREIQAGYENNLTEQVQTPGQLEEEVAELEAFYVACGGVNRDGGISGLGSAAAHFYQDRMLHRRNAGAASYSRFGGASTSSTDNMQTQLQAIQERLDGFNAERVRFIEHLDRVDERQQRADERLQSINLHVDANEVSELRGRLVDIERELGPSLRRIQTTLDRLEAKERLESGSNLDL